jgi:hypothetical protein
MMETAMRSWSQGLALATTACLLLAGCGGDDSTTAEPDKATKNVRSDDATADANAGQSGVRGIPFASIPTLDDEDDANEQADINVTRPDEGTPEWFILQIIELQQTLPPATDDVEKLRAARRVRNQQIVEFATNAIAATHDDPQKVQVFNVAVHRLMGATYELAMQSDQTSVDALYGHAESLFKRDPSSRSARESAWFVVRFANENARRFADQDPRWVEEFSQQARIFAERFSADARAIGLLTDAAVSCEYYGRNSEATLCYKTLTDVFPKSKQAAQAVAPLRRLALVGKSLDLGGPTVDGAYLTVENFKGSPVLIAFWSTQAKPFVENAPRILRTVAKHEANGLQVIGVNLDTDELAIESFVEKTGLGWRTLFHADQGKRGWSHPVAVYYGVRSIPQFWFVNADGTVATTALTPSTLNAGLEKLMAGQRKK